MKTYRSSRVLPPRVLDGKPGAKKPKVVLPVAEQDRALSRADGPVPAARDGSGEVVSRVKEVLEFKEFVLQ